VRYWRQESAVDRGNDVWTDTSWAALGFRVDDHPFLAIHLDHPDAAPADLKRPGGPERPAVHALRVAWTEGRIFKRDEERHGWCVVLDEELVGPTALLAAPEDAREGSVTWFLGPGDVVELGPPSRRRGPLAAVPLPEDPALSGAPVVPRWLGEPEACLVLAGDADDPIALDPSRLTVDGERWRVDESLAVSTGWNGAAVVARADGALLGLLVVTDDTVTVAPLP